MPSPEQMRHEFLAVEHGFIYAAHAQFQIGKTDLRFVQSRRITRLLRQQQRTLPGCQGSFERPVDFVDE